MTVIWNLFAKNPFRSLQDLMQEILLCLLQTKELFNILDVQNQQKIIEMSETISKIEHKCDGLKQKLRFQISKSVFLPIDHRDFLQVLFHMDAIANTCEDIGILFTLRKMEIPAWLKKSIRKLLNNSCHVVHESSQVIKNLDRLFETGFSGPDAIEILKKIDEIDLLEHETCKALNEVEKVLFQNEDNLKPAALFMWIKIANKIGDLAKNSEKMAGNIRFMLSLNQ